MFRIAISRGPVYTAISIFKVVFSTLQSSSYYQLANSCLLWGYEGLLLWIDILSFFVFFLLPLVYFRGDLLGVLVRLVLFVILSQLSGC